MITLAKKIVSFFMTVLFLLRQLPKAMRGRRFLRHADPDVFYIVCPCSIGDIVVASVAAQYLPTDKRIVILIRGNYRSLNGKLGAAECLANSALARNAEWYILLFNRYRGKNYIYGHFHHDVSRLRVRRRYELTAWEDYCRNVYQIPTQSLHRCHQPIPSGCTHTLTKQDVILCPYAHSMKPVPQDFWQTLTDRLHACGFTVYTNVAAKETPVPGTQAFVCGLDAIAAAVSDCAAVVSLRSGICDYLAVYSEAHLVVLSRPQVILSSEKPDRAENWDVSFLREDGVDNFIFEESRQAELIDGIVAAVQLPKETNYES